MHTFSGPLLCIGVTWAHLKLCGYIPWFMQLSKSFAKNGDKISRVFVHSNATLINGKMRSKTAQSFYDVAENLEKTAKTFSIKLKYMYAEYVGASVLCMITRIFARGKALCFHRNVDTCFVDWLLATHRILRLCNVQEQQYYRESKSK